MTTIRGHGISIPLSPECAELLLENDGLAEDLARHYDAKVILLQVVEPVPLSVGFEGAPTVLPEDYERHPADAT